MRRVNLTPIYRSSKNKIVFRNVFGIAEDANLFYSNGCSGVFYDIEVPVRNQSREVKDALILVMNYTDFNEL